MNGHRRSWNVLLITCVCFCVERTARSQGTVVIANDSSSLVYVCENNALVAAPVGNTFQLEVMYAPDGTPQADFDSAAVRLGGAFGFGPAPGRFNSGTRTAPGITPAGGFGLFQVRGWEAAFGGSYLQVVAGGTGRAGKSVIIRIDTGDPTTTPAGTPGTLIGSGFQSFTIGYPEPCPEPAPLALVGTALGAFVGYRLFRKSSIQ